MLFSLLPLEIWDQIIDHLHNDATALSACALVHRAWTASARSHLFHHVSIMYSEDDLSLISEVFPTSGGGVVPYVRDLRILGHRTKFKHVGILPVSDLPYFSSVTRLVISCEEPWEQIRHIDRQWLAQHVQNCSTLRMSIDFEKLENCQSLIASATRLQVLDIAFGDRIYCVEQANTIPSHHSPPPMLELIFGFNPRYEDLNPERTTILGLIQWIQSYESRYKLKTFRVDGFWAHLPNTVATCIGKILPFIEHLELESDSPFRTC